MPIITPHTALFAIPKTGSQWAIAAMNAGGVRSNTVLLHDAPNPDVLAAYASLLTWTVVRHPLAWFRSWHAWTKRHTPREDGGVHNFAGPVGELADIYRPALDSCLRVCIDQKPGIVGRIFDAYSNGVAVTMKLEGMPDALCGLLRIACETFDEPALRAVKPVNASTAAPEPVNASLVAAFLSAEMACCERYGY